MYNTNYIQYTYIYDGLIVIVIIYIFIKKIAVYLYLKFHDTYRFISSIGKTHIKIEFFLVVGPLRFYPPYTNGLVVHVTFFLVLVFLILIA